MKTVYALLALLALAGALLWAGHHRGYDDGVAATQQAANKEVDAAKANTRHAEAERDAATQTLANVQSVLDTTKVQLAAQRALVKQTMADNTALKGQLAAKARQHQRKTLEVGHADPTCADLAHLPVCPSVARRLWGPAAVRPSAARH
jgi:hypothetical protein